MSHRLPVLPSSSSLPSDSTSLGSAGSRSPRPPRLPARFARRVLLVGTCLCLSGAAFMAVARVELPARSLPPQAQSQATPPIAPSASSTPAASPVAAAESAPSPTLMPDFKGKRLTAVRREAKRLGFRVAARDDLGERVMAEEAYLYRVRRQNIAAGEPVPAAGTLEVTVRETGDSAGGY